MASKETSEESVLYKTHTSIEKLSNGNCIKRISETRNGKTEVTEEIIDCEKAIQGVHEKQDKSEDEFRKGNADFDERMREKLKDINANFSGENKQNVHSKEETFSDGKNKVVKVTRESNSIEETKKTEKIPNGTRRMLKVTRESFLEETEKSVKPEDNVPEEELEGVKLLDESFAEEANPENKKTSDNLPEVLENAKEEEEEGEEEENDNRQEIDETVPESADERFSEDNMKVVPAEDGFLKRIFKSIFKILFFPLYKLNIL